MYALRLPVSQQDSEAQAGVPERTEGIVSLTKQQVAGAIGIAVDEARENPELEAADIVNSVLARVIEDAGDQSETSPEVKKAAHQRLHAAAAQADELGEGAERAQINALIGIGLALLANGEDAEMFYSVFLAGQAHNA